MTHSFYPAPDGPLPPKQADVFAFIQEQIMAGQPFPSPECIAERMGWKSPSSAIDCLHRLRWRGKVECIEAKSKSYPKRYEWVIAKADPPAIESVT